MPERDGTAGSAVLPHDCVRGGVRVRVCVLQWRGMPCMQLVP